MVAIFNFESMLQIFLLTCCTCAYIRSLWPGLIDSQLGLAYFVLILHKIGLFKGVHNEKYVIRALTR